ncbi:unnamed protein product [Adineta ricciae]|uniref:EF-hand domain-containing protein n=1 Tax=Adineta ricciae TaxID=249248 RepID=A0A813Z018_ADIRI|nr:unnamed protein product [Adineta ricciae]
MANTSDEMRQYREAFSLFDKDHDDIIAPQELGVVLRSCGLSPSEADLQKIQQQVGRKIDFNTFVRVAQDFRANHRETEDDIREAFRVFDKDGTGYVSVSELKHAMISLGERLSEEEVDELIREADIDADGRCNCEDLKSSSSGNSKNFVIDPNEKVVPKDEIFSFIVRCMLKVDTRPSHAEVLADNLSMADYRGHYSHGLNRLDMYVNDIRNETTAKDGDPVILKESPGTALVDGQNLLGPYVGKFCMNLAMEKAKKIGIGLVAARRSNHFGIAGYYSLKAVDNDLIGWAFTNTSPLVVPTRSKAQSLGTNPIAFGAPARNGDSFVLDMATSTVALGKVEISQRRGSDIPNTWGVNAEGVPVTKPQEVQGLLALGGPEESSGYKGYGLAMMVEILCGILSGSHFGPWIRSWKSGTSEANLGQCFIAINPNAFEDDFDQRLQKLINYCRSLPPTETGKPVLIAGDPERAHMALCDKLGGIPYPPSQIEFLRSLARSLKVDLPNIQ